MKRRRTKGQMIRGAFQEKNVDRWEERFEDSLRVTYLRGGEDVISGRLSGRNVVVLGDRSGPSSNAVTEAWRIKDKNTGRVFNIRSIIPSEGGGWIDFTCETGVPT